jgi:hypothetical protein
MNKWSFGFNTYIVEFPSNMLYKYYDDEYSSGLILLNNEYYYDITHNKQANWNRILINSKDGYIKDLPFNEDTWKFLPEGVKIYAYKHS